jgi:hypothetical protein
MVTKFAEYKGKTYVLAWQGDTKFGHRAKLMFLDRSKEFWVDNKLIKERTSPPQHRFGRSWGRCWECGCEAYVDEDGYCGC